MSEKGFDVMIYVPFNSKDLNEHDMNWVNSFQSILDLSLKQITKQEIKFITSYADNTAESNDAACLIYLCIYPDFKVDFTTSEKLKIKKQIQVNAHPKIKQTFDNNSLVINLFDENKNKVIDITGKFNELKNETWLKFLDISYEIKSTLHDLKESKKTRGNIYVAETSNEQNINRETVIRELEHLGYRVLPETQFPKDMVSFSELVQRDMKECFLSIHIIGNFYAPLLENIDISSIEMQNDLFHEVAAEVNSNNKKLKRLVWIPPDIKPKSEKQKLYIESFKRNIELLKNTEIIQAPIEVFKTIIKDKAEDILRSKVTQTNKLTNEKLVYLISNQSKGDNYKKIKEKLVKNKLEVLEIKESTNKIDLIQNHYYNLINCDALLIDYSVENQQWLNSKLSDIVKSPGFGRKKAFMAKSVIVNTAESPELSIRINNLDVVNNKNQDINTRLASFIDKINNNDT